MDKKFEDLPEEEKKKMFDEWNKKKDLDEPAVKEMPLKKVFIPLGAEYNSKFTLWKNSLQIVKSHKVGTEWTDTQNINLSKRMLIELMARIPAFVAEMEAHEE